MGPKNCPNTLSLTWLPLVKIIHVNLMIKAGRIRKVLYTESQKTDMGRFHVKTGHLSKLAQEKSEKPGTVGMYARFS